MPDDAPDAGLSKYRLDRLLGAGGMGVVYLARDLRLNRDVALKFVSPDRLGNDEDARLRLLREAQAAAALEHPAICAVYDVEVASDGRTCIVMQYVEGDSLADRLRRGPLPPREALAIVEQIADALAAAHRRGIVHRDLKPQNIILTPSGRPKLLDFGIASVADTALSATALTQSATAPGLPAGTPGYMSPEQVHQRPVDGRSDLFSLGAVLFECLTGKRAFEARTPLETYDRVLHAHPPAVSSVQPDLTERHDELCRRLLAKDPADRFQSADELLGALRLLKTDTGYPSPVGVSETDRQQDASRASKRRRNRRIAAAGAAVAIAAALLAWRALRIQPLPAPPPEAARWYERARVHIADGAYHSARLALRQAIAAFPGYVQAHTRLAEAHLALDEESAAQNALLEVTKLVNPARLPPDDRIRYEAIRAQALHDAGTALETWRALASRSPNDPRAWLDLARAQEAAARPAEARASFEKALTLDRDFAAAHLRLAWLEAQEGNRNAADAAFAEAERLYKAGSNIEGEIEVLLRRGTFLDGIGELKNARAALERARALALQVQSMFHQVRAELHLSSVTATEGDVAGSERLAKNAVQRALDADLDTVAAEGLIELGATLTYIGGRGEDANLHLNRAIDLAKRRGAGRLVGRATLNLASLRLDQNQPADALKLAEGTLDMIRARNERRLELSALSIIARAHEDLTEYGRAREIARKVLAVAREIEDESQIATALENLCSQNSALGLLPEALSCREEVEAIYQRQQNAANLAFSLANRAELLIRLGRGDEAEAPLRAIEAGAAAGSDAYAGRLRRVLLLRALRATCTLDFGAAGRFADAVMQKSGARDSTWLLAAALWLHANAQLGRRSLPPLVAEVEKELQGRPPGLLRDVSYWLVATRLAAGNASQALTAVSGALAQTNAGFPAELQWRLEALGAAAAKRLGDNERAAALAAHASSRLADLRQAWGAHAASYERRPDLRVLRTSAGLPGSS